MHYHTLTFAGTALLILALCKGSVANDRLELVKDEGTSVLYLARVNTGETVVLDANNGFFDKGAFRADGQHAAPAWDADLIKAHFTHLIPIGNSKDSAARWYVWVPEKGNVDVRVELQDAAGKWTISLGGMKRSLVVSDGEVQPVEFPVQEAGLHTVALSRISGTAPTKVKQLTLTGNAAKNARVLRARWRPAAVHTQYHCSDCPKTRMWVFESQSLTEATSYSPMTTQFGYFGGSFDADRTAHGNLNFSMWAASSKAKAAPPLNTMPHLIGTGNPLAQFSGFGHEGSGVKIRNWDPIAKASHSITLALRVETNQNIDTFTGYFFHDAEKRWVLFAKANKPVKNKRGRKPSDPTYLRPASFCEVPGPPAVQRTGDRRRVIRRRGWFYGDDAQWHGVDRQTTKSAGPTNKFIAAEDGWFQMGTGGMEMITPEPETTLVPSSPLPGYLSAEMTKQLFQHPIEFGRSSVTRVTDRSAVINYDLKDAGTRAEGVLYYGPIDCLTFVARKLHGTESKGVSTEMLAPDRTWASKTDAISLQTGANSIELHDLQPGTKYYYRLLVQNAEGKCWAPLSDSFTTK